jgi:hypothetical protein
MFVKRCDGFDTSGTVMKLVESAPQKWNFVPPTVPPVITESDEQICDGTVDGGRQGFESQNGDGVQPNIPSVHSKNNDAQLK